MILYKKHKRKIDSIELTSEWPSGSPLPLIDFWLPAWPSFLVVSCNKNTQSSILYYVIADIND